MTYLTVKGFGGLELKGSDFSIQRFPTHHVGELLGYLLLNQNKPCDREHLIELLWPHQVRENARGSLNTVLWRLRSLFKKLGFNAKSFLLSTRDQIIFSPSFPLQFDVDSFEQHIDTALLASDDGIRELELTQAIALYQGDLYTGIFTDWCLVERERLACRYIQALCELMNLYIRQEEYHEAIAIGQLVLSNDPLREEVHRELIYCYGHLGLRAEAAAQFKLCTDSLMTELQVFPRRDTVAAHQQAMATCISHIFDTQKSTLIRDAFRAYVEFQQAGDKLAMLLAEIDKVSPNS
ncbi:MAG: BTAD domain-containing putative transcriptional regulator [Candidatus Promineifilaceae bacterium]|nr:BTAD domain-containing putative transcriptional regulator [Candidatus Promineifilaceae bacterium]